MSGPYRPLVHELGDDVIAALKGVLEGAVTKALQPEEPRRRASLFIAMVDLIEGSIGRRLCEAFGFDTIACWRDPRDATFVVAAKRRGRRESTRRRESLFEDSLDRTNPLFDMLRQLELQFEARERAEENPIRVDAEAAPLVNEPAPRKLR